MVVNLQKKPLHRQVNPNNVSSVLTGPFSISVLFIFCVSKFPSEALSAMQLRQQGWKAGVSEHLPKKCKQMVGFVVC